MLLIALTPDYTDGGTVGTKMAGVVLASLSSGGGELSFLGLTHFYGSFSLAAWGSGTGGAGLIGAGAYSLATTTLGLSVQTSLFASSFLPVIMLLSFFVILPQGPLTRSENSLQRKKREAQSNHTSDEFLSGAEDPLLRQHDEAALSSKISESTAEDSRLSPSWRKDFLSNLRRARGLVLP